MQQRRSHARQDPKQIDDKPPNPTLGPDRHTLRHDHDDGKLKDKRCRQYLRRPDDQRGEKEFRRLRVINHTDTEIGLRGVDDNDGLM